MKKSRTMKQVADNLAETHPALAAQWHPTKNPFGPECVTKGSHRRVVWLGTCGHEWTATVSGRVYQNHGCPYCANRKLLMDFNDFSTRFPALAAEWHPLKNDSPIPPALPKRRTKVWWHCSVCGNEWSAVLGNRIRGSGCPACANKRKGNRAPHSATALPGKPESKP